MANFLKLFMKQLFLLLLVGLVGLGGYIYFFDPSLLEKHAPGLAKLIPLAPKEAVVAGIVAADAADAPAGSSQPAAPASPGSPAAKPVVSSASASAPKSSAVPATQAVAPAAPETLDTIRLKDDTVITGKIVITDEDITWIRTADGKTKEVPTRDIRSGLPSLR